jgi:hypothetical protein
LLGNKIIIPLRYWMSIPISFPKHIPFFHQLIWRRTKKKNGEVYEGDIYGMKYYRHGR